MLWQAGTPALPAMCLREETSPGGAGLCACSLVSMLWQAETPALLEDISRGWKAAPTGDFIFGRG